MMGASSGATIRNSVVMGNDLYQDESPSKSGDPSIGTGRNAVIEGAIIDKNARIGNEVVITPEGKPANMDGDSFMRKALKAPNTWPKSLNRRRRSSAVQLLKMSKPKRNLEFRISNFRRDLQRVHRRRNAVSALF